MPDTFLGNIFLLKFEYLMDILNLEDRPPPLLNIFTNMKTRFTLSYSVLFYNFLYLPQFDQVYINSKNGNDKINKLYNLKK